MWLNIIFLLAGLFLLQRGAAWFVNGSSSLARKFHISELTIGLTIVAFGTSAPELVVNSFAASSGNHEIVFGNIIGSNIFNLFVILSIIGFIHPAKVQSSTAWKEIPFSFISLLLLFIITNDQLIFNKAKSQIGLLDGIILLIAFALFIFYAFRQLKSDAIPREDAENPEKNYKILLLVVFGLTGLVVGGKLVVDHAVKIAMEIGISEKMVGLLIVAPGTSLPELATSIVAIIKKKNDIAVGNIIGSNIFNVLFILPISAFIKPLIYNTDFNFDVIFLAIGTVILFMAMYTGKKKQIDRWEAFVLLALYIGYIVWIF